MAGGHQNESTSDNRAKVSRSRFEQDVVRFDATPWYLKPDRHERDTGDAFKYSSYSVLSLGTICHLATSDLYPAL